MNRGVNFSISILIFGCSVLSAYQRLEVNMDYVSSLAEAQANGETPIAQTPLPESLAALTYDDYRNIRFRKNHALWLGDDAKFIVDYFHPGYIFKETVNIYEATNTHEQQIPFSRDFFNYEQTNIDPNIIPRDLGFAGIRIRYPLNNPEIFDDLIVFQGASYFRALGQGNNYGLSARGLGYGIGEPGETFPRFSNIWLKKPTPEAKSLTVYALMEGQHASGAFEFTINPGSPTVVGVRARVWPIGDPTRLCFAPMTSMFYFGENTERDVQDWRPEVHDSDGLLIQEGKQWLWRPVTNPSSITHQAFKTTNLKGFGLLQRDRRFGSYKDLEAHYEKRPSLWITPVGKWPEGEVVLAELPTPNETEDNVNAFWRPAQPPANGKFYELAYNMSWRSSEPNEALANVLETRVGQKTLNANVTTFVVEFSPPPVPFDELKVDFQCDGPDAQTEPQLILNESENSVRVFFDLSRRISRPHTLQLTLTHNNKPVSETWCYKWPH